jgi:hypothetical protein
MANRKTFVKERKFTEKHYHRTQKNVGAFFATQKTGLCGASASLSRQNRPIPMPSPKRGENAGFAVPPQVRVLFAYILHGENQDRFPRTRIYGCRFALIRKDKT